MNQPRREAKRGGRLVDTLGVTCRRPDQRRCLGAVVTAIPAAIAVPRFGSSMAIHRADTAAQRIAADLTLAQRRAKMTSASQRLAFKPADSRYELIGGNYMDHVDRAYVVSLAEPPYEAEIESADLGGDLKVIFDGYGRPDSGGRVIIRVGDFVRQIDRDADTSKVVTQ